MACRACGLAHSPLIRCEVAAATNASNKVASNADASNKTVPQEGVRTARPAAPPDTVSGAGAKQRWAREAYNRYQRDYMRARRARVVS